MTAVFLDLRINNRFSISGDLNPEQIKEARAKLKDLLALAEDPELLRMQAQREALRKDNMDLYRHAVDGTVTQLMLSSFGVRHGFSGNAASRLWTAYGLDGRATVTVAELATLRKSPRRKNAGRTVMRLFDAFLEANRPE